MEWIRQLQDAVDYMEAHLLENVNYEDAARSVFLSAYSFHRSFSMLAGLTPTEYIRRRRLSLAGCELQDTDITVLDAALKYGYETPESFSKAFSRFHGITPKQAKQSGAPLRLFSPLVLKFTLEGGTAMDYRIVKRERQTFLARKKAFPCSAAGSGDDRSIPAFWDECRKDGSIDMMLSLCSADERDLYGLCSPAEPGADTFVYGIGVRIEDERTEIPADQAFCVWQTEETVYAAVKCRGEDGKSIDRIWEWFYREFLPQTGYRQTELTDFELYREKPEPGVFCELWIPVKKA